MPTLQYYNPQGILIGVLYKRVLVVIYFSIIKNMSQLFIIFIALSCLVAAEKAKLDKVDIFLEHHPFDRTQYDHATIFDKICRSKFSQTPRISSLLKYVLECPSLVIFN